MKFLVALLCLAATVAAEPEADAQVAFGYPAYAYNNYGYGYRYPVYAYGPTGSSYQHVSTPFSETAVHQLHKREAEPQGVLPYVASPYVAAPYAYNPYYYAYAPVASSYQRLTTPFADTAVHQLHKREAEPQSVAVHPGLAVSSTFRSPQGAGAPALYGYPSVYGYGYGYPTYGAYAPHYLGKREADAEPQSIAAHPGFGLSSTYRSTQGAPALYPYAHYYNNYYGYNGLYGYNGYF
jgi:hypothetical protein